MKIYCDSCNKDITLKVDKTIEDYIPGQITCPYCQKKQKRYISEADLMMYFTISCLLYIIAAYILLKIETLVGFTWILIPILLAAFIGIYFLQKSISRSVYVKAYGKSDIKNNALFEDTKNITKRMRVQYAVFICLIVLLGTGTYDLLIFVVVSLAFVIVSSIKLFSLIKKEKKIK